ncbi:biopolymer transporter ExbD [Thiomicrorhabdus sediminis]|uniref:Biopolymer transporter ExbD n=1 Tax=Thiomicrorhabdus sediminis TaxID=2580412 RepID=A0A4P9K454_9GAMM|nr:biopolymer transporter ExbD [Thiomicrorhabdus sediminis]QCU89699.1 biopolymer transporter ExbD [Thiomicrorhabdus sediminis]
MIRNKMKRFDGINVIPLIDVMLVLLAVVLMTASFIVKDSLEVDLPETSNSQPYQQPNDTPLVKIVVDKDNQVYIGKTAYNETQLQEFIQTLDKTQPVSLEVDKQAQFGSFVAVIDLLKGEQLNNLSILTKAETANQIQ